MKIFKEKKNKGFTLIEMLVSVALFSIVLTIAIGSIITIIDVNRKSQTLTLVMNNLNFALESMTRTIKTATMIHTSGSLIYFKEQYDKETDIGGDWVAYNWNESESTLERCKDEYRSGIDPSCSDFVPIISSQIKVEAFRMEILRDEEDEQWRIFMVARGKAQLSPKISSDFSVQTTVTPRRLNYPYD